MSMTNRQESSVDSVPNSYVANFILPNRGSEKPGNRKFQVVIHFCELEYELLPTVSSSQYPELFAWAAI
jgi:hypothetical protein